MVCGVLAEMRKPLHRSSLLPHSERVKRRFRDAAFGCTYHCHLDLSFQMSVFGTSCQLKWLTTRQEQLKTINRKAA